MKKIEPQKLYQELDNNNDILLIDVREPFELEICSLPDAVHIPMQQIPNSLHSIPAEKKLVIMCHHGIRSAQVVNWLETQGYGNVFNLTGGIDAWAQNVDKKMVTY